MQRIVREYVSSWTDVDDIYNTCSGAFTVERTIASVGKRLHSNDVLLYSAAIGRYFAGDPMPLQLTELAVTEFPWLADYQSDDAADPAGDLANLLLASRLAEMLGRHNAYYDKLRAAYAAQWPQMHATTRQRVLDATEGLKLASFDCEDAATWVTRIPENAGVVSYPPFIGFKDTFGKIFERLERMYVWEPPEYTPLDSDAQIEMISQLTSRRHWMYGTNRAIPDLEPYLRSRTRPTNRGTTIYVYASDGPTRLVTPTGRLQFWPGRHLTTEDLGDDIKLVVLQHGQFHALRSQYMNAGIRPGAESLALAVVLDDLLCGVFAYSWAPSAADWSTYLPQQPSVYLLSDFPVSCSKYRKLSKLIVMAAISEEAVALARRYGRRRWQSITTTAYSQRPVSMKYRGVLRLLRRRDNDAMDKGWAKDHIDPSDSYYTRPYELQYGAPFPGRSLAEQLAEWKRRYGQDVKPIDKPADNLADKSRDNSGDKSGDKSQLVPARGDEQ